MSKRRAKIFCGILLLMLTGIGLTISTLHSHHNLELHNSADFADTGQCLNSDIILCPICGYVIEATDASNIDNSTFFKPLTKLELTNRTALLNNTYIPVLGRSPPSTA